MRRVRKIERRRVLRQMKGEGRKRDLRMKARERGRERDLGGKRQIERK